MPRSGIIFWDMALKTQSMATSVLPCVFASKGSNANPIVSATYGTCRRAYEKILISTVRQWKHKRLKAVEGLVALLNT